MLFATRCFQQFGIVALGPLVQLLAGGVERKAREAGEYACSNVAVIFLQALPHLLLQLLLVGQDCLRVRRDSFTEPVVPLLHFPVP